MNTITVPFELFNSLAVMRYGQLDNHEIVGRALKLIDEHKCREAALEEFAHIPVENDLHIRKDLGFQTSVSSGMRENVVYKEISLQRCVDHEYWRGMNDTEPCRRCGHHWLEHMQAKHSAITPKQDGEKLQARVTEEMIEEEAERLCTIFNGHSMLFAYKGQHEIIKSKWRAVAKAAISDPASSNS